MNRKIFAVMPFVLIGLLTGVFTGLTRMGWSIPLGAIGGQHGAIMVGSFLGTLILLERVVVLKKRWLYLFPVISGVSILLFWLGKPGAAFWALSAGAAGLVLVYLLLLRLYPEYYFYIMLTGALAWLAGNITVLVTGSYPQASTWWILFVLLTVTGERLELSKFLPDRPLKKPMLFGLTILILAGAALDAHGVGRWLSGIGFIALAGWFFRYDIARKSVKAIGIHRYTGSLLLLAYFWLAVSGVLLLAGPVSPLSYDAVLHSFFLGFTFSMIFAHGPVILPGVAGLPVKPYHPSIYLWTILLQVSLATRLIADYGFWMDLRKAAGMINAIVVVAFFLHLLILVRLKFLEWEKADIRKRY